MSTTKSGWKMTRDATTGNYALSCTPSGFTAQEMSITVKCGNKNMTGDLVVDVKAQSASLTASAVTSTSELTVTKKNNDKLTVSGYPQVSISTATPSYYPGWYTGGNYNPYNSSIGEISTNKIVTTVYTSDTSVPHNDVTSGRYKVVMNPNCIYVILSDKTSMYSYSTGDTVIWDNNSNLQGGAVIFYNKSEGYWNCIPHSARATGAHYSCNPSNNTTKEKTVWLSTDKYMRETLITVAFGTVWGRATNSVNPNIDLQRD